MKFLKRFYIALMWGPELESLVKEKREEAEKQAFKDKELNLKLCFKHQQEQDRSHYSEHNCDYCILSRQVGNLCESIGKK
jgi:hypothetical protein